MEEPNKHQIADTQTYAQHNLQAWEFYKRQETVWHKCKVYSNVCTYGASTTKSEVRDSKDCRDSGNINNSASTDDDADGGQSIIPSTHSQDGAWMGEQHFTI